MAEVLPNRVSRTPKIGCTEVSAYSKHWPCLFPQHGPGKKHERKIELTPWQQELVDRRATRWIVSTPDKVAQAIVDAANGKAERYVPRAYAAVPVLRALAPGLLRRAGRGDGFTPSTTAK